MIAKIVKATITYCKAKCNKVLIGGGNYIGINVKFVNRGSIELKNHVTIRPSTHVYSNSPESRIVFESGTEIGRGSNISSVHSIVFEEDVLTGPRVFISDHNHEYENPQVSVCKQGVRCREQDEVRIGSGSWLGTNVVIVGNVHIGKHCVIGANSVVTKDIPDYSLAVGSPAKVVKHYDFETDAWVKNQ